MTETSLPLPKADLRHKLPAYAADLLLVAALVVVAWAIGRDYVQPSLFSWGDNPGQFMRMWYPLAVSLPQRGLVMDWNPIWYAGYPELQFYPPGSVLVSLLLHLITLGRLSPEHLYNLTLALAFVLPLFTCFAFLRSALAPLGSWPSRIAGLAAGLLAVSFTPMWGGIDAVVIGLIGERLAFGVAPLGLLAGWKLVERPGPRRLALAAGALAGLLLLHPFHAPAVVLAVAVYALARHWMQGGRPAVPLSRLALWLGGWLLLAIALIAWWVVPLVAHYSPYAASLVRARPDQVLSWFDAFYVPSLWVAALPALLLLAHPHARLRASVIALVALIPLLLGGILFNDRVLLGLLGWSVFDPIRFIAEYYLAIILLVGSAVGAAASRFLWRTWPAALAALLLLGTAVQPILPRLWQDLRTHAAVPDHFRLETLRQAPAFSGLWETLADDPSGGRVLFLSYYLRLAWSEGEILPTSLQSMTPYLSGREIVGGTFSHWSPVARWLWVGDAWARVLPAQVEADDDRKLFGIRWDEMNDAELAARLRALHVTTLVAGPDNPRARALVDSSSHFTRTWDNGFFTLYHLSQPSPGWVEAEGATVRLIERTARRWVVAVDEQTPGATLTLKMGHYPLWRAQVWRAQVWRAQAAGETLPITATAEGLQRIALLDGAPYTLEIAYREGPLEWGSGALTLVTLALAGLMLWPRAPHRPMNAE